MAIKSEELIKKPKVSKTTKPNLKISKKQKDKDAKVVIIDTPILNDISTSKPKRTISKKTILPPNNSKNNKTEKVEKIKNGTTSAEKNISKKTIKEPVKSKKATSVSKEENLKPVAKQKRALHLNISNKKISDNTEIIEFENKENTVQTNKKETIINQNSSFFSEPSVFQRFNIDISNIDEPETPEVIISKEEIISTILNGENVNSSTKESNEYDFVSEDDEYDFVSYDVNNLMTIDNTNDDIENTDNTIEYIDEINDIENINNINNEDSQIIENTNDILDKEDTENINEEFDEYSSEDITEEIEDTNEISDEDITKDILEDFISEDLISIDDIISSDTNLNSSSDNEIIDNETDYLQEAADNIETLENIPEKTSVNKFFESSIPSIDENNNSYLKKSSFSSIFKKFSFDESELLESSVNNFENINTSLNINSAVPDVNNALANSNVEEKDITELEANASTNTLVIPTIDVNDVNSTSVNSTDIENNSNDFYTNIITPEANTSLDEDILDVDNDNDIDNTSSENLDVEDISLDNLDIDDISLDDLDINDISLDDLDINDISLDDLDINDISLDDLDIDIDLDNIEIDDVNTNESNVTTDDVETTEDPIVDNEYLDYDNEFEEILNSKENDDVEYLSDIELDKEIEKYLEKKNPTNKSNDDNDDEFSIEKYFGIYKDEFNNDYEDEELEEDSKTELDETVEENNETALDEIIEENIETESVNEITEEDTANNSVSENNLNSISKLLESFNNTVSLLSDRIADLKNTDKNIQDNENINLDDISLDANSLVPNIDTEKSVEDILFEKFSDSNIIDEASKNELLSEVLSEDSNNTEETEKLNDSTSDFFKIIDSLSKAITDLENASDSPVIEEDIIEEPISPTPVLESELEQKQELESELKVEPELDTQEQESEIETELENESIINETENLDETLSELLEGDQELEQALLLDEEESLLLQKEVENGKAINILINEDDIFSISILNETYEIVADFDGISVLSENIHISTPKNNFYVKVGEKYIEIHNHKDHYLVNTNFEDIEFANAINNVTFAKKRNKIELNIKEAFKISSVNKKIELSMLNTSIANLTGSANAEKSDDDSSICDNKTLLISEETQKVYLPYTIEEVMKKLNDSSEYQTIEDVVENEYTLPLSTFKNPIISRFREAYKFMREKEKSSVYAALDLAVELMFNSDLNPAVIRASKDLKELNIYLDCLYENEIEKFDCFKVVYKVLPKIQ